MTKFSYKIGCNLRLQPYSIFFLLEVNFDKSTIELHFLRISFMLAKYLKNERSIDMSSINCLKLYRKYKFIYHIVNNNKLT